MHIPKMKLYRMGSDPEALFVKPVDFDWIITPAYDIIGRDKKKTTASFIGTDSRPVIAEIRPNPSRNLKRHLYEIAYAITTTADYLDSSAKWKGNKLMAYPHILGENLGGHIHASMFLDDPLYLKLKSVGLTFGGGGHYLAQYNGGTGDAPRNRELETEVMQAIQTRSHITPLVWGQAMSWLLTPFEKWVQPWVAREQRNAHYGAEMSPDAVRLGTSKQPFEIPKMAYVHWEYRLPSTWLQHPWLAYAYLGIAKLGLLNMKKLMGLYLEEGKGQKKGQTVAEAFEAPDGLGMPTQFTILKHGDPSEAGAAFVRNMNRLLPGAHVSRDLLNLMGVVEKCAARRGAWFSKPTPVDVEAWRQLL